jgi:plasmid stability protein
MSKMIQIRNVPDSIHRVLKSRAAMAGVSLSDYILRELKEWTEHPTNEELRARMAKREPVSVKVSVADVLREEREAR